MALGVPSQGLAWPCKTGTPSCPGTQAEDTQVEGPSLSLTCEATRAPTEDRATRPTHLRQLLRAPAEDSGVWLEVSCMCMDKPSGPNPHDQLAEHALWLRSNSFKMKFSFLLPAQTLFYVIMTILWQSLAQITEPIFHNLAPQRSSRRLIDQA